MLTALAIGGCSSVSGGTGQLVKLAVTGRRAAMPTAAEVAANPYPQMYVRTPTGQGVLVLGNVDDGREAWYGRGHVVVFVRDGQVVRTAGLSQNLEGMHWAGDTPFARGLQHLATPLESTRREDWSGYRYGVPVRARFEPIGITHIDVLGTSHEVLHVRETLAAPAARYHAVNEYWVGTSDGVVWKSVQSIAPGESITLVQLKPYRSARR